MDEQMLYFNGVNGETGEWGMPPMTSADLAAFIRGDARPENLSELRRQAKMSGREGRGTKGTDEDLENLPELRSRYLSYTQQYLGIKEGYDLRNLSEAGWGVIFASDADPAVKEALSELLDLRREQAGERFRVFEGPNGYRRDKDTKSSFLARHGVGPGPADPDKMPYYLLLVGSPEAIPYDCQVQLDLQYGVGRVHFDTLPEYANYAASVVAAERARLRLPRRAVFFGAAGSGDVAGTNLARLLLDPLRMALRTRNPDWDAQMLVGPEANKSRLAALINGGDPPALLALAGHGMEFPVDSPRQSRHQGALLCADWPGPGAWGHRPVGPDFYFSGDDVAPDARLLGTIAFMFASFSAGLPQFDDFSRQAFKERMPVAPRASVAELPKRLLGHPAGGALAVIGHVQRAWAFSVESKQTAMQAQMLDSTLQRLLSGEPVGAALDMVSVRWAELATVLSSELQEIEFGKAADPYELADMWTANNDARSYVLIGDPAVRLPVARGDDKPTWRETIRQQEQFSGDIPRPVYM